MDNNFRPVRVGILGAGYIAEWHLKALRSIPGAQTVAVADVDHDRARALAQDHGVPRTFRTLEEMLAANAVDAVHVLVPPQHHFSAAQLALRGNIDVLLEKPMCINQQQCAELLASAATSGKKLGVSHNFLFFDAYEKFRRDLAAGLVGRIDHVTIVWHKPLGQLVSGPFHIWMLQDPRNIMLEVGAHCVAHLLDMLPPPDEMRVAASDRITLPSGADFYRRWRVSAECGAAAADLLFGFRPGFSEQYIHVRGSHGSAIIDFENNVYRLDRSTRYGTDVDRFVRGRRSGNAVRQQARGNLLRYVLEKARLGNDGNAFGASIRRSMECFYAASRQNLDRRITGAFGQQVIACCQRIGEQAGLPAAAPKQSPATLAGAPAPRQVSILVLGASGFIGRELVKQLAAAGHPVRALSRGPAGVNDTLSGMVEWMRGSIGNADDIQRALEGITHVYHLARANVKRWEDYYQQDVLPTKQIAEACIKANVRRLIYTGTIDSYYAGANGTPIREETGLDPKLNRRNYYAQAKGMGENILMDLHRQRGLPVVIVRPGIVIGAGGSPFHWGVGMWSGSTACQIWGSGDHPLPTVLVEDVAAALVRCLDAPGIEGQSFNLVGEPLLSARQYMDALQECLHVKLDATPTPIWKFYAADMFKWIVKCAVRHPDRKRPSYRDWASRTQAATFDCSKAKTVLAWKPVADRAELIARGVQQPADEMMR